MTAAARSIVLTGIAFLVLVLLETSWLHVLGPLEGQLLDLWVRRHAQTVDADPDIVIVNIDNASLGRMTDVAGSWPWPRAVFGELVQGIARQKPRAIVFDVSFDTPDVYRPESDRLFNDVLRQVDRVFFPMERRPDLDSADGVPPVSRLATLLGLIPTAQADGNAPMAIVPPRALDEPLWKFAGTAKFEADADGVGRRYGVLPSEHGWLVPSLPARVAQSLGYAVPAVPDITLSWASKTTFRRIPFVELYEDFEREKPLRPQDELTGKIVLIGAGASGLHDLRVTPLDSQYSGVAMLATAIANLKSGSMMQTTPRWWVPALSALLLALVAQAFLRSAHALKASLALLLVTLCTLALSHGAVAHGYRVAVLAPLAVAWAYFFACALRAYLQERASRMHTVQLFGRFVNPHVVQELVAHGGLRRNGESRDISVLFSDIRGFSTLCEGRSAEEVVALLNRYFALQVEVVFRHGGSLDKFIGDCIMAFWGAPLDDPQHAVHAVQAGIEMAQVLEQFKQELGRQDIDFDVGIGIHTGTAVVGLIGSEQRREYTAIGDTVNLASRIEGLTKGMCRILVSRETMLRCGDAIAFVPRGTHKVKGREQEVELFEPVDRIAASNRLSTTP